MNVTLVALLAYAMGYAAAHYRPGHLLDNWAWDQIERANRAHRAGRHWRSPRWYAAQAVFSAEVAGLFVTHPRRITHQWRHRNDPPPQSETLRFDAERAEKRRAAGGWSYRCACGDSWPDQSLGVGHTYTRCAPMDGA